MRSVESSWSKDKILIRNPTFVLREEGGEGSILFDPDTGAVRLLNSTATAFLKQVNGERTMADVVQTVKAEFLDVATDADSQLEQVAQRLNAIGAIGVRVEGTAGGCS